MASLKKCNDCGQEISKKAKQCPKCGAPQGPKHYSLGKLVLFLIIGGFIYSLFSSEKNTSNNIPQPTATPKKQAISEEVATPEQQINFVKKFENHEKVVKTSFSESIISDMSYEDNKLNITLVDPKKMKDYFTTGDKINKVLAIESARLFYKIPDLDTLNIFLNLNSGKYHLKITRKELETYYKINMESIREYWENGLLKIGDKWRNRFLAKYDNKKERLKFVNHFVK